MVDEELVEQIVLFKQANPNSSLRKIGSVFKLQHNTVKAYLQFYIDNVDPNFKINTKLEPNIKLNREQIKEKFQKWQKIKSKNSISFALSCRIKSRLSNYLYLFFKDYKYSSYKINIDQIVHYLLYKNPNITNPKQLKNYEVDHIKSLSSFNFINLDGSKNLEEVKKAFAPENHQLISIKQHREKTRREFKIKKEQKVDTSLDKSDCRQHLTALDCTALIGVGNA